MSDLPFGTVAFLFTDIQGSTNRWESDSVAMGAAVERHIALLDRAIVAHNGHRFKIIGDAVQAAFETVPNAISAAKDAQSALQLEEWGVLGPLRVRMAIHAGEAYPKDGDYLAPPLNRLSRALNTGYGEQILLTEAARALATSLPIGHSLQDLGLHRLRDLLEAEHIYQLAGPGLRAEFPPLNSLDRHPNNLPDQLTPFIGRESELESLQEMILATAGRRLVTITGPGGTGKTRLALQAAADVLVKQTAEEPLRHFPDGVFVVDLGSISDPKLVVSAIATTLSLREEGRQPIDVVTTYLRDRRLLLILDTFEHVREGSNYVDTILEKCPGLKMLVTSRTRLRARAEQLYPLDPLAVPDLSGSLDLATVERSDAVNLFVERAKAVKPKFALTAENAPTVAHIVRRLDGLPLAIELAAARILLLTPVALLARLKRVLPELTSGPGSAPARQRTLRATIDWSHNLLSNEDKILFRRLSVFVGGWMSDAAEAICGREVEVSIFQGLASLFEQNLVRSGEAPDGNPRYAMLDTIKEYASDQLEESGEIEELRAVHAVYYRDWAEKASAEFFGAAHSIRRKQFEQEDGNLRQALNRALEKEEVELLLRLAGAIGPFWKFAGRYTDGRPWLSAVLDRVNRVPVELEAKALAGLIPFAAGTQEGAKHCNRLEVILKSADLNCQERASLSLALVDLAPGEARISHEEKIALVQEAIASGCLSNSETTNETTWAYFLLGNQLKDVPKWSEAINALRHALTLAEASSNPMAQVAAESALFYVSMLTGHRAESMSWAERHLDLATQEDLPHEFAPAHKNMSWALMYLGHFGTALKHAEQGMEIAKERSDISELIRVERRRAEVLDRQGRFELSVPAYEDLIRKDGDDRPISRATTQALLGVSYIRQGESEYSLAQKVLEKSLSDYHIHTRPIALIALGELHLELKDDLNATERLREALEISADRPHYLAQSRLGLARAALARSRIDEASDHAQRVRELASDNGYVDLLAYLHLLEGHSAWDPSTSDPGSGFDEALENYQQACMHALRYNRYLLDEILEEGTSPTLPPIILHCTNRRIDGPDMLKRLLDWWMTGRTNDGESLIKAEDVARTRENIPEQSQIGVGDRLARWL